jgi:hypothetical protein
MVRLGGGWKWWLRVCTGGNIGRALVSVLVGKGRGQLDEILRKKGVKSFLN